MSRPDISGNTIASKFFLERRLGSGHFGDVYLAQHIVVGRQVALKVIPVHPSTYSSAALEAQLLNLSTHDHIVLVHSAEYWRNPRGEDFCLIEMELVDGGDLQGLIDSNISIGDIIDLMKNILFALEHSHQNGIIHRDIKPTNILMGDGGKLSDFGIAMVSATGASSSAYIYNGNLAPECHAKPPDFSISSDIFASGLTLLRALNLISDWGAARSAIPDWQSKMAAGTFVGALGFHKRVPDKLKRIVRKACNRQSTSRYQSAGAMRDALETLNVIRNWRKVGPYHWACTFDGADEALSMSPDKGMWSVSYSRSGRRKVAECRARLSEAEALDHISDVIARTTLG